MDLEAELAKAAQDVQDFRVAEYKKILRLIKQGMEAADEGKDAASLANEGRIAAIELGELDDSWDPMPVLDDLDSYCSEWLEGATGTDRTAVSKAWRAILKAKAELGGTGRVTIMDHYPGRGDNVVSIKAGKSGKGGDLGKRNSGVSSTRGKKGLKGKR